MKEEKQPLVFDVYEDSILLIDEEQFVANRHWVQQQLGSISRQEWTLLMLPTAGSIDVELGGEPHHCGVGQVMVCMLSDGIEVRHITPDFVSRTIGMSVDFVSALDISDTLSSGLAVHRHPVINVDTQVRNSILMIFDQLRGLISAADNPYRFRAVQLMVETYYYSIGYYLHRDADTVRRTGGEVLTDQYLRLVRRDCKQHRTLDHYADALYVSKKHLSTTVSRTTGIPATQWIERGVVQWAKQQLTHSTLTIGQIADDLHFKNQSHFGTYFKRIVGQSPEAYRHHKHHPTPTEGEKQ